MTTTLLFLETRKINLYVVIKSSKKKKKKRSTTVHMWSKTSDSGIALLWMILNDWAIFLRCLFSFTGPHVKVS